MAEDFVITRQQRVSVLTPEGIPEMGYRVHFSIPDIGTYDWVDVVERDHTPERINALIEAKVENTRAIFGGG